MKSSKHIIRIHTTESFKLNNKAFYEFLVGYLKENKYAGVTVLRGIAGFGHNRIMHTSDMVDLSTDLPIIIEVIDNREQTENLLSQFRQWNVLSACLVTSAELTVES